MKTKAFNWREFGLLLVAGILGVIAVLPYTLTLQAPLLENLPIPLAILLPLQLLQNAVLLAVAVGLGLLLANRTGLGAPIIEGWLAGEQVGPRLRSILTPSVLWGVIAGVAVTALELLIFAPRLPQAFSQIAQPPAWQGFLASFYGGIDEEIFMRLFLMSLLAWLLARLWRTEEGLPTGGAMWTANVATAVIFGLGHLPATAVLMPLTPLVIARAILLNSVAGVIFGYLYWKRGLESAMFSHFSADIVLHVIPPLLVG
ncbi:MAG: CPBP family intramembrane glutamic endopeptidase [Anaerolineae bacterium]